MFFSTLFWREHDLQIYIIELSGLYIANQRLFSEKNYPHFLRVTLDPVCSSGGTLLFYILNSIFFSLPGRNDRIKPYLFIYLL